jgi:large subunit ribosomal protein L24
MSTKLKFRKGDKVIVLTGKEKGKRGEILKVQPAEMRAVVQGVNMAKRHTRPGRGQTGGIVERELSIHLSNLSHVDPKSNEATRVGYKLLDDGRKVRFAKKSGEVIDS